MMKKIRILSLVLITLLISTAAWAQKFEITPYAGYRSWGGFNVNSTSVIADYVRLRLKAGFAYGVSLGIKMNEIVTLEAMWIRSNSALKGKTAVNEVELFELWEDQYHLNVLFYVGEEMMRLRPYALVGLGVAYINPKSDISGETRFSFSLGGGVVAMFSERVGLKLQGKWLATYVNTSSAIFVDWWGYPWIVPVSQYMSQMELTGGLVFRF